MFSTTRRQLLPIIFALLLAAIAQVVAAHPLGNFSVNRYSRIAFDDQMLRLTYIVDMAEIPALNNRPTIDTNGDDLISSAEADSYAATIIPLLSEQLRVEIDSTALPLTYLSHALTFPEGQAGLLTQRLVVEYEATLPAQRGALTFSDSNYADRVGWSEIVVDPGSGFAISNATLPTTDTSNQLLAYPEDVRPLAETEIALTFAVGAGGTVEAVNGLESAELGFLATERFTELITFDVLTPRLIAVSLLFAFVLGGAHALSPGHGKTIVAAYLVGSRGTPKHALLLGLTTTITHTIGVFFFGLVVLFASRFLLPEDLFPWIGVLSGLLVVFIGISLARAHWQRRFGKSAQSEELPADYHTHFGIGHSHIGNHQDHSIRNVLALGVSGGLLPCPSALVVLLSAIALQRVGFGLILITVFSLGLATVLTLLGFFFVYAGNRLSQIANPQHPVLQLMPIASACFVTLAGIGITWRAVLSAL